MSGGKSETMYLDIPRQYKSIVDEQHIILMNAAKKIYAIVAELGCNEFNIENGYIKIMISKLSEDYRKVT